MRKKVEKVKDVKHVARISEFILDYLLVDRCKGNQYELARMLKMTYKECNRWIGEIKKGHNNYKMLEAMLTLLFGDEESPLEDLAAEYRERLAKGRETMCIHDDEIKEMAGLVGQRGADMAPDVAAYAILEKANELLEEMRKTFCPKIEIADRCRACPFLTNGIGCPCIQFVRYLSWCILTVFPYMKNE